MKSLAGVYLKEELEEDSVDGTTLYPFMLIFPNKRRIYYLTSKEDKDKWVKAITATETPKSFINLNSFD